MGLPIWKDPDEERRNADAGKGDPTAAARSPIRRRSGNNLQRRNPRASLHREPTFSSHRREPSPPRVARYNASPSPRRSTNRSLPPISTLLEPADRRSAVPSPPPPRVNAPNDYGLPVSLVREDREASVARMARQYPALAEGLRNRSRRLAGASNAASVRDQRRREANRIAAAINPGVESTDRLPVPRTRFVTREHTPFHRSPEPMSAEERVAAALTDATRQRNLPTPPHEALEDQDADSLFVPHTERMRPGPRVREPRVLTSPLRNSWRPESPINGLGDRNRSPTPADGWEIMQTTIEPDVALPSADSSFTSAAASPSFTSNETSLTEPDQEPQSGIRSNITIERDSASDSASDLDNDEIMGDRDENEETDKYAQEMYQYELQSEEGMSRILRHRRAFATEGHKFTLANESDEVELGFRLIDEALETDEGRERLLEISRRHALLGGHPLGDVLAAGRVEGRRTSEESVLENEQPCPPPENRVTSQDAAREANANVHNYFRRFNADSLTETRSRSPYPGRLSPPPEYEALPADAALSTAISREPPVPHPVSPPNSHSRSETGDLLLAGDEQDLGALRRIVERLAQRDDVPDEWWMSMGLNLSRTRVTARTSTVSESHVGGRAEQARLQHVVESMPRL